MRWRITERVKRLAGNEIELGIGYRRSNLGQVTYDDKGNNVCCYAVRPIKIFVEYVGTNMGIQVPLLVIDQRCVSVMSTSFSNRRVRTLKVSMTVILWVYVFWCTEGCSESRIWLRTWRGVSKWSRHKDWYIGRIYLDTGKVPGEFGNIPELREVTGTPR